MTNVMLRMAIVHSHGWAMTLTETSVETLRVVVVMLSMVSIRLVATGGTVLVARQVAQAHLPVNKDVYKHYQMHVSTTISVLQI